MLLSSIPTKFDVPFASGAGGSYITSPLPVTTSAPGRASLTLGFPTTTFQPVASGGNPPWGADMNGILNQVTAWLQWGQAGGFPVARDATFQTTIGGYPNNAMLRAATLGDGKFWISTADNNTSNPDASGANWLPFPDLAVQKQKPNYAIATGTTNAYVVTLSPTTSFANLVGSPVRFKAPSTNSITNPTVNINGSGTAVMVNSDGTALGVGQISAGNIVEGIPRDDGKFQVNSPVKAVTAATAFVTGVIYIWPNETAPVGTLECAGQSLLIASYPALYAILGTRYGGNGVSTFNLPDLRGEFLRGWDHGRGLDPNAGSRTNSGGGIIGDHVGTNELGCAGPISISGGTITIDNPQVRTTNTGTFHTIGDGPYDGGDGGSGGTDFVKTIRVGLVDELIGTLAFSGSSGAETRPVNINMMFVIAI